MLVKVNVLGDQIWSPPSLALSQVSTKNQFQGGWVAAAAFGPPYMSSRRLTCWRLDRYMPPCLNSWTINSQVTHTNETLQQSWQWVGVGYSNQSLTYAKITRCRSLKEKTIDSMHFCELILIQSLEEEESHFCHLIETALVLFDLFNSLHLLQLINLKKN